MNDFLPRLSTPVRGTTSAEPRAPGASRAVALRRPCDKINRMSETATFTFDAASEAETDRLVRPRWPPRFPAGRSSPSSARSAPAKRGWFRPSPQSHGVPREQAASPTFVLVHEYQGRLPIYHFDAYRLRDEDEFNELGPEEYFESAGVTFIEWADRVAGSLPAERIEIACEATGETSRRFAVTATTKGLSNVISSLRESLSHG